MNTFSYIVHKLNASSDEQYYFDLTNLSMNNKSAYFAMDLNNTIKSTNGFTRCTLIQKMIFDLQVSLHNNTSNNNKMQKYDFIRMICRLDFVNMDDKTYILSLYTRAQRYYFALCRLAFIFKFKRAPLIIATDLYLSNIKHDERNVITIFQNKQRYLFTITDLNKIIETAVCNSPYFVSEPLPVKNPYNNLPFSKSDLYNIYLQIRDRLIKTPQVIYQFFLSNFNLSKFQQNNRCLIREKYIEQFLVNEDKDTLVSYIHSTLSYNNKIIIDDNFPDDILIRVFKPYLRLYLMMSYSLDISVRRVAKANLVNKLKQFYIYNPMFGRKIVSITKDNKKRTITYNDKHIHFELFTKKRDDNFLKSHLSIKPNSGSSNNQNESQDDDNDNDDDTVDEYDSDDSEDTIDGTILGEMNHIANTTTAEVNNMSPEIPIYESHNINNSSMEINNTIINDNDPPLTMEDLLSSESDNSNNSSMDINNDMEFRRQILQNISEPPSLTMDDLMLTLFPQPNLLITPRLILPPSVQTIPQQSIQFTSHFIIPRPIQSRPIQSRPIQYIDVDFNEDGNDEFDP